MNTFFVVLAYTPSDSTDAHLTNEMIKAKDIDAAMDKMLKKWRKRKDVELGDCFAWEQTTMERMFAGKI